MKKKVIIIVIVILVILLCLFGFININKDKTVDTKTKTNNGTTTTNNGVVKNTNEGVIKEQKFQDLDLTNISLSYVKGTGSTFKVKVTNNTDKTINLNAIDIILKDKDGNVITTLYGFLGGNIEPRQENAVKTTSNDDLTNAYSVEYRVSTE